METDNFDEELAAFEAEQDRLLRDAEAEAAAEVGAVNDWEPVNGSQDSD